MMDQAQYEKNPLREEFLQQGYYNNFNQYNLKELITHMQCHQKILNEAQESKE